MLTLERASAAYSKAQNRRDLMTIVHRSEGSIERKLQNISAVLDMLGTQWINGYKPLAHYQDALVAAVERSVGETPDFLYPAITDTQPLPLNDDAVFVAPPSAGDFDKTLPPAVRRLVGKFDPAERDAKTTNWAKPARSLSWSLSATVCDAPDVKTLRMTSAGFPI